MSASRTPAARTHGLTGRALTLGLVVVLLAVVLASPLHRYLAARNALAQARHDSVQSASQLAALTVQRRKWDDPAYVMQQARERLQYARPGETVYVVVRPGDERKSDVTSAVPHSTTVVGQTWSSRLWGSVQAADNSS